jgi:endonuclease/exonuclease/phosphatase family metal-dependent hydrolase
VPEPEPAAEPPPQPAPPPPAPAEPPAAAPAGGGQTTVRVLHWNTHHGGVGTDGVFDPDRLVWWVVQMQPDIISFNEVDDAGQAAMLHALVNAYTGTTWTSTFSGWGNQILTRLPAHDSSVCTFNPGAGRRAAHLSVAVNGRTLNIWSAHLAVDSASARLSEVYALQDCAQVWPEARIIAGDYNMQQSSTEYGAAAASYTDAWAAARSQGTAVNYSGNCDGCTRNSRIDYVFSSHGAWFLTVESAQIYDTADGSGHRPSDHKPMVVTYRVQ